MGPTGAGPWARVGYFVGPAAAYPQLTVRENLEIARRLQGLRNPEVTRRSIQLFGLADYAQRKAAALSTGNLQRLGLARALLHDPELLILDEPANGLDPSGVVEVRELLRSLVHDHGVTIFMSSHILTEVDRLATRIGIIHQGRLIEELDSKSLERLRAPHLQIQARNMAAARTAFLKAAGFDVRATDGTLAVTGNRAVQAPDEVASLLVHGGTPPTRLVVAQEDLESHFLRLIGRRWMINFRAAFWAEMLKARRSMIVLLTALGVAMLPLAGGLFMIILKDPEAARNMGLISAKAQIMAGTADWPAYFGILLQGTAVAGAVIFALITSWVFGSEFSNRTNTQLLALPTPRHVIVVAKFALLALWIIALGLLDLS